MIENIIIKLKLMLNKKSTLVSPERKAIYIDTKESLVNMLLDNAKEEKEEKDEKLEKNVVIPIFQVKCYFII